MILVYNDSTTVVFELDSNSKNTHPTMPSFEIHYGTATNYNDAFLEQCDADPFVLTKIEDGKCHIYLIVTEQEIRAGYTGLLTFWTREDSATCH